MGVFQFYLNRNDMLSRRLSDRAKLHYFVDGVSLCGKYEQQEDDADIFESGEVATRPHIACKKCYEKWKKQYRVTDEE